MTREKQIEELMDKHPDAIFVATTGKISRELYELRIKRLEPADDFYMMGSMGHAPAIALGIIKSTDKKVVVLSGDGSAAMRLGTALRVDNYPRIYHYILDNGAYDSTGGQPTCFNELKHAFKCSTNMVFPVDKGCREDLGRVQLKPHEIVQRVYDKIHS